MPNRLPHQPKENGHDTNCRPVLHFQGFQCTVQPGVRGAYRRRSFAKMDESEGFKTIHAAMDFRVGGTYHYGLERADGMQMWGKQVFREIVPNERLTSIQSFSDKD